MKALPGGRRRHHRARHALLRPDGRRPGDPGGRPARAEGRPDAGEDARSMARDFRAGDDDTPIVLMGYYNPIYVYGVDRFLADAQAAGVDGLIVVDLPPEMDDELCIPALQGRLNFIRLATPTTDDKRLPKVLHEHVGLRLLRLDDRHHRLGAGRHRRRSRRAVERIKAPHRPAGLRRLRRQDRRAGARHRRVGRRRRGRLGHRQRGRQRRSARRARRRPIRPRPWRRWSRGLAQGVRAARLAAAE